MTALMNAAESGSLEAVEALLTEGADAGAMSTTAFTPLIVAASGGHLPVVKVGSIIVAGTFYRVWRRMTSPSWEHLRRSAESCDMINVDSVLLSLFHPSMIYIGCFY